MKTEEWAGYPIRFVDHGGEWYAVAKDVADALGYRDANNMLRHIDDTDKGTHSVSTPGGEQPMLVIAEFGIYDAVFRSRRPEAREFKRWVFGIIKQLREASGIEGFQVFRMMDKQHQRAADNRLQAALARPTRVDHIKANIIADKAVSNMYGRDKLIKKPTMTPEMLRTRQQVVDTTARTSWPRVTALAYRSVSAVRFTASTMLPRLRHKKTAAPRDDR